MLKPGAPRPLVPRGLVCAPPPPPRPDCISTARTTTATTIAPAGIAMPIVQLWGPAFSWTHTMTVEASRLPMLMKM